MKLPKFIALTTLTATSPALAGGQPVAAQTHSSDTWTFDVSPFGLAAGRSGKVTLRGIDADRVAGFDDVLANLEFDAMDSVRVGYDQGSFRTEVGYMRLGASKNGVNADMDQWVVEPTISYRVWKSFEPLVGAHDNNLNGELRGPGILPTARIPFGSQA